MPLGTLDFIRLSFHNETYSPTSEVENALQPATYVFYHQLIACVPIEEFYRKYNLFFTTKYYSFLIFATKKYRCYPARFIDIFSLS